MFSQELRYGLRQLRRSPGFFAIAASLIAIGIAATTQIFSLVDALFLRPLPVSNPQNLVQLFEHQQKRPADPYFDYTFYKQLAAASSTLSNLIGQWNTTHALEQNGHTERVHTVSVTDNYFPELGITPLVGRVIAAGDRHVAVLSYSYWSRSFNRDPNVIGQSVRLQDHAYTIIGVAPEPFTGTSIDSSPDLWMPFANQLDFSRTPNPDLNHYYIEILARLKPGVSILQAQQETAAAWNRYMKPGANYSLKRGVLEIHSLEHGISPLREQSKTALELLMAGTVLLLLIVCANVGGLLLSRATARERETSIRLALGATRARILRQWLIESLMLSLIGGAAGLVLAYAAMPLLMHWMPPAQGGSFDPAEIRTLDLHLHVDLRVLGFSFFAVAFTTIICAFAPSINVNRNRFFQSGLCGFQIALCTMLLLSAGLIIRSLTNLKASNPGFDQSHVTLFAIDPDVRGYDGPKTWLLQQKLLGGVRELPGVDGAALAYRALMRGIGLGTAVVFPGQRGDGVVNTSFNGVSPDYFQVMGMHMLAGRTLSSADHDPAEAVVNEAFVRKFLNGRNPIGEEFSTGQQFVKPTIVIVGVVNDTRYRSLREIPPPTYYTNEFGPKQYRDTFILHVRTHGDPHAIIEPVRQIVRSLDPAIPIYQVATLSEEVDRSLWQEHLLVALTSCFGVFALALSTIGLYGILAYFVTRRRREIGLRLALGATANHIVRLVASRIAPTIAAGILAGAALSWFASAWVQSFLYGVGAFDPVTTLSTILLLVGLGVAGAIAPTIRALRVDPSTTLRQD
jgi:predicted permease